MNSLNSGNKNMSCFEHCFDHCKGPFARCSYPAYLQVSESIPPIQRVASSGSVHSYGAAYGGCSEIALISVDRFTFYG